MHLDVHESHHARAKRHRLRDYSGDSLCPSAWTGQEMNGEKHAIQNGRIFRELWRVKAVLCTTLNMPTPEEQLETATLGSSGPNRHGVSLSASLASDLCHRRQNPTSPLQHGASRCRTVKSKTMMKEEHSRSYASKKPVCGKVMFPKLSTFF